MTLPREVATSRVCRRVGGRIDRTDTSVRCERRCPDGRSRCTGNRHLVGDEPTRIRYECLKAARSLHHDRTAVLTLIERERSIRRLPSTSLEARAHPSVTSCALVTPAARRRPAWWWPTNQAGRRSTAPRQSPAPGACLQSSVGRAQRSRSWIQYHRRGTEHNRAASVTSKVGIMSGSPSRRAMADR